MEDNLLIITRNGRNSYLIKLYYRWFEEITVYSKKINYDAFPEEEAEIELYAKSFMNQQNLPHQFLYLKSQMVGHN